MAETWFTPKEWKARLVEFAGRRLLRNVANGQSATYDVSRSEGLVSQEGDAFNTKNMNDLEQRISNGFANAKTNIDALNRDLGGLTFAQDSDGNWGYKIGGADPVIPFNHFSVLEVPMESNEFSLSLNFAPKFIAVHASNIPQKILGYSGFSIKDGVSSGITAAGSTLNMTVKFEGHKITAYVPIFVREAGHKYTVVVC